ncbi:uncharacterized protein LOC114530028 [Dendronephthya gigantea]|uniref:uncharacterized protein LOC114530028 n=1 Tax=Dendronephthya gigantea TaxID=151771 RepID=UPI00106A7902|nr:uncharacterized protein LOC114530028 [Dendronephthya gigantea]
MLLRILVVLWTIIHAYQAFEVGKSFSILDGLKPVLPNANSFNQTFYPVDSSNLFQNVQTKTVQSSYSHFGYFIQLTYHADENDLIKVFFSMWNFAEEKRYAGPLTLQQNVNGETNMKSEHSSLLGISPENLMGKVYVLARYWKVLNTTMAVDVPTSPLTNTVLNSGGNKILDTFSEYGTHYVSGYQMGDLIYQVFVYDKNDAERVLKFPFNNPNYGFGLWGHYYRMYTELKTERGKGFCLEAGKVLTASNDPAWLNIASQLRDDVFRVPQSIFMFVAQYGGYLLPRKLTTIIPIKLYFKPLVTKLLPGDSKLQKVWNDVLSATVFQKFGPESQPNFSTIIDSGIEDFYDSFNPSLVTSTATNYVTITRMSFVLNDFFVSNPTFVTHVFIFADVLKLRASKIKLPGSQKIYLICREMVALSSNNIAPEIIVGAYDNSVPTLKIVAKTMRGVFKVTQAKTNEHFTYANDEVYKTSKHPSHSGQYSVSTDNSKRLYKPDRISLPELYFSENTLYEMKWLQDGLVSSVQLSVTTIESILTLRSYAADSVNTARKCLKWMTDFLTMKKPNSTTQLPTDLEMALARALLISKTRLNKYAQSRQLVPKLTFSMYKPLYDKLLAEVSAYENIFQTISTEIFYHKSRETTTQTMKELNDNVKRIGSFLVQKTEVGAQYQDDIAGTNQQLHDLESDRISREQEQAAILWTEITNTQKEVTDAGIALKEAIEKCKTEQIISAGFGVISVVGSLFTGGAGALNIAKDIEGIVRVAKKVEIAIGIIEQVNKLYSLGRELRNDIGKYYTEF